MILQDVFTRNGVEIEELEDRRWLVGQLRRGIPQPLPPIVEWAEEHVSVWGVKGKKFIQSHTPWTRFPIECCDKPGMRFVTLVKPVQTGGSVVGEIAVCRWIVRGFGEIQWNWQDDARALERWKKRLEKILKSCGPVMERWPVGGLERFKATNCLVVFPNCSLTVQGVFVPNNLDSDSIAFQVNEEIHTWPPGMLEKAFKRGTACAFPISLNISNAGYKDDQLHEAFRSGTMREWEVPCPGCSNPHHPANTVYHVMRIQWDDDRPDLGGLRYDSKGCKRDDGTFDYNRLASTLRYQMPCGYTIHHEDIQTRRQLSNGGRYSEPRNKGALWSNESMIYEAVISHDINWLGLVQEKHSALRALKNGNPEPWRIYLQERESKFYSAEQRPVEAVVINVNLRKNREGLPDRAARFWAADKQKGYRARGEIKHYWLAIRDCKENADSRLVFEGMVQTDADLVGHLLEHDCAVYSCPRGGNHDFRVAKPGNCSVCGVPLMSAFPTGCIDSTWDRDNVLQFCYHSGMNALHVSPQDKPFYHRNEKVHRLWSEPEPIHKILNIRPKYDYQKAYDPEQQAIVWVPHQDEPRIWSGHQIGMLKLLFFLRNHEANVRANYPNASDEMVIKYETPGDVSDDYKEQNAAWEYVIEQRGRSQSAVEQLKKVNGEKGADHLMMCEAYIAKLIAMSGILPGRLAALGVGLSVIGDSDRNS